MRAKITDPSWLCDVRCFCAREFEQDETGIILLLPSIPDRLTASLLFLYHHPSGLRLGFTCALQVYFCLFVVVLPSSPTLLGRTTMGSGTSALQHTPENPDSVMALLLLLLVSSHVLLRDSRPTTYGICFLLALLLARLLAPAKKNTANLRLLKNTVISFSAPAYHLQYLLALCSSSPSSKFCVVGKMVHFSVGKCPHLFAPSTVLFFLSPLADFFFVEMAFVVQMRFSTRARQTHF